MRGKHCLPIFASKDEPRQWYGYIYPSKLRKIGEVDQAVFMRTNHLSDAPVIAIVDDDEAVREALSNLLQVLGYSTCTFDRAADFLMEISNRSFDCLITDVKMPGIGGLELQEILRMMGSSIPVIIITSYTDPVTMQRALEKGAVAYISKPFADEELLRHLQRLFDFNASQDGNV